MTPRRFLEISDLDVDSLARVLMMASLSPAPPALAGKGVALVFEKPSARTRNSAELAVFQLGGHPVSIRGEEVGLDARETVEDVTLTLAQYHAAIAARVFDHEVLERMAAVSPVPVINLLSNVGHPCQALADLLTLQARWGGSGAFGAFDSFGGRTLAWVGDGNNVCRSLMLAAAMSGVAFRAACPPGYEPDAEAVECAGRLGPAILVTAEVAEAVNGADAVYTDVWTSMGQEDQRASRQRAFAGYVVDEALMGRAAPDAVFLHCLPAHRGEEVTAGVIDGPQSLVWPQAANRMHAMRGLLLWLLESP